MTALGAIIPAAGLIGMVFSVFCFRPRKLSFVWKILPFALVGYYAAEWYFDFVVYRDSDLTPQLTAIITVIGILILLPLLLATFRFGYSKEFED
jgi:hypothetical protein